jgi:hypothetical protein
MSEKPGLHFTDNFAIATALFLRTSASGPDMIDTTR